MNKTKRADASTLSTEKLERELKGRFLGEWRLRRGMISGMEDRGNAKVVTAMVPLANMFGYINTLRSMSQGRAQYTMLFDHYEPVPAQVAQQVKESLGV